MGAVRGVVTVGVAAAVGCGPACAASDGDGPGTGEPSTTDDATTETGDDTTPEWPAPDCATLMLPGDPDDVAATPRPDRDAEVLALQIEPALFVARQDRYDVIAFDLTAIRELDPTLANVHIECDLPRGYEFWIWGDSDYFFMDAIFRRHYEAWDCHNDFYGIDFPLSGPSDVWMLDGRGFAVRMDGVFAAAILDVYLALPGFEELDAGPFWGEAPSDDDSCELNAGRITLEATQDDDGALVDRTYTFEPPGLAASTWIVEGDGSPTPG